jgi:uncharacterized membrane protein YdbT with pleckstrin-like domain
VEPEAGEQVFFHGHPSWLSMLAFYMKGLLASIVAGVIAGGATAIAVSHVQVGWVIVAVLVVFIVVGLAGLVRRITTTYTVSDERLTIHVGLLSRDLHQTRLERVQNVNLRQSLWERVLRIGRVDFATAGEAGYNFAFDGVAHPHEIVRTVHQALRRQEEQREI